MRGEGGGFAGGQRPLNRPSGTLGFTGWLTRHSVRCGGLHAGLITIVPSGLGLCFLIGHPALSMRPDRDSPDSQALPNVKPKGGSYVSHLWVTCDIWRAGVSEAQRKPIGGRRNGLQFLWVKMPGITRDLELHQPRDSAGLDGREARRKNRRGLRRCVRYFRCCSEEAATWRRIE